MTYIGVSTFKTLELRRSCLQTIRYTLIPSTLLNLKVAYEEQSAVEEFIEDKTIMAINQSCLIRLKFELKLMNYSKSLCYTFVEFLYFFQVERKDLA